MKERLLEILEELKQLNNIMFDFIIDKINNNKSIISINNDEIVKGYNSQIEKMQKEFQVLVFEYESELIANQMKDVIQDFGEAIKKAVEEITEQEDDNVS